MRLHGSYEEATKKNRRSFATALKLIHAQADVPICPMPAVEPTNSPRRRVVCTGDPLPSGQPIFPLFSLSSLLLGGERYPGGMRTTLVAS